MVKEWSDKMKLKILGTQSPYSTIGHNCPGFLVSDGENKIMLDCRKWKS